VEVTDAMGAVSEYCVLQGRLVRHFLAKYSPRDLDRFRDVPNGSFVLGAECWKHTRHGVGVSFESDDGVSVNAHVGMVDFPEGVDGGRLFEYLSSKGVRCVRFDGTMYDVEYRDMVRLVTRMADCGRLKRVRGEAPYGTVFNSNITGFNVIR
jgi:hypothetical protein